MTYALDLLSAFAARGSDVLFEAKFAVELAFLFDEADVLERPIAPAVGAHEVVGAPDTTQGGDERTPGVMQIIRYDSDISLKALFPQINTPLIFSKVSTSCVLHSFRCR